jgi:hypothetical protein
LALRTVSWSRSFLIVARAATTAAWAARSARINAQRIEIVWQRVGRGCHGPSRFKFGRLAEDEPDRC